MITPIVRRISMVVLLSMSGKLCADGEFRIFPGTLSPDRAYVLAWGERGTKEGGFAGMKEVSDEGKHFDVENGEFENYLVATEGKRPVAVIPGFDYFSGPEGSFNHRDISVAWSKDSHKALFNYHGRYSYESILWVDIEKRKFTDIGSQLEKALHGVIAEKESKKIMELANSLSFSDEAIVGDDTLLITGYATSAGDKDAPVIDLQYHLKFKFTEAKSGVTFKLVEAKSVSADGDNQFPRESGKPSKN